MTVTIPITMLVYRLNSKENIVREKFTMWPPELQLIRALFTAKKEQVTDMFPICSKSKIHTVAMAIQMTGTCFLFAVTGVSTHLELI